METYTLLRTMPVFIDVRRRVRAWYHGLKHVHPALRLGLQLVEISLQLALLFSWPIIILCYFPIIITDRVIHHTLALVIKCCPALMGPAPQVYDMVFAYTMSFTIGRVVVFFLLLASYILAFLFECCKVAVSFLLFFIAPFREEEAQPLRQWRLSPPRAPSPCPSHGHHSHIPARYLFRPPPRPVSPLPPTPPTQSPPRSPSPPPSPPPQRTVVLPGAEQGPARVVEAVAQEVSVHDVGPGRQLEEPLVLRPPPKPVRMVVPADRPLQCVAQ